MLKFTNTNIIISELALEKNMGPYFSVTNFHNIN